MYSEIDQSSSSSFREYDSNFEEKEKNSSSSVPFRQVSVISEESDDLTSPLHQSNYALDFRHSTNENLSKKSIENNIKGFVDGCVRTSIHDMSLVNRDDNCKLILI